MDKSLGTSCAQPPRDRRNIAFIILILQGIGFLLPWNVFINARVYFVDYKLNTNTSSDADYRDNFLHYIGFAAQFPGLTFAAIHTFFQARSHASSVKSNNFRFLTAMFVEMIVLLITIILAFIDTSKIPGVFFTLTIISVVVINCCVGIHQTLTFGLAASLPMKYSNAVVIGSNACGTIISLFNIATKAGAQVYGDTDRSRVIAAVAYFSSAFIIVISCALTYLTLARLEFVRYFRELGEIEVNKLCGEAQTRPSDLGADDDLLLSKKQQELKDVTKTAEEDTTKRPLLLTTTDVPRYLTTSEDDAEVEVRLNDEAGASEGACFTLRNCFGVCCFRAPQGTRACRVYWQRYLQTFKECWVHCLSVYLVFLCTLSLFPGIQSKIKPNDQDYFIPAQWFSEVTCFLFFNLFAMLGCVASSYLQFPSPKWIWLPVLVRLVIFVPFFLLSNVTGKKPYNIYVTNDHAYVFGAILFGFSNGYLSSLCMMYAPRNSPPERAQLAGMLAAFFLVFGVFSGVYCGRFLAMLI